MYYLYNINSPADNEGERGKYKKGANISLFTVFFFTTVNPNFNLEGSVHTIPCDD